MYNENVLFMQFLKIYVKSRNKHTHLQSTDLRQRRWNTQCRKDGLFSKWLLGKLDSCMQINEVRTHAQTIQKINSKWLKDLNTRHDIIKLLEENMAELSNLSQSKVSLGQSPKKKQK